MAEYLILAENVTFKNEKLTCINVYDKFTTVAMPAEFTFDLAIMCGPNWSVGEHHLAVKARGSNGKEVEIGELTVNIPHEDFVYNAFANDLKLIMDYSVSDLTIVVYDNDKEIITRKYPVVSMLVPQNNPQVTDSVEQNTEQEEQDSEKKESKAKREKVKQ